MKVVLFCGGLGTRLREYTGEIPKPMVKIGYRPILWHLMKYYAHFGHKEFILCLGYKADVVKQFFLNYEEWVSNDFTMTKGGREMRLENSDIEDWKITFVDTGLGSNIGQRLVAVKRYVEDEEMFLANYSDGLTDLDLPTMVATFRDSGKVASFLASRPSQSFHLVDLEGDGEVRSIRPVRESNVIINAGFFCLRREVFDYIRPRGELVNAPVHPPIAERKLLGYPDDKFWGLDTFQEQHEVTHLDNSGEAPLELSEQRDARSPA